MNFGRRSADGIAATVRSLEIVGSRWKIALYLAVSLGFVAIGVLMLGDPEEAAWKALLGLGFFGLCALIFLWLLIRPQRLLLDGQGFTIGGGLVRSPKLVRWRDIEPFFVYRLPKGGKMVGYNYRPGARSDGMLAQISRRLGADGALPKGWPMSPEALVDDLNAFRARALGEGEPRPSA
jgi:hypothetical protein